MLLDRFQKIKVEWTNKSIQIQYGSISKKSLFELSYHAANDVPTRNIYVHMKPGDDEVGNEGIFYLPVEKAFIHIIGNEDHVVITLYAEEESKLSSIQEIEQKLRKMINDFNTRSPILQDQITKTILVERKIDKVIHLAMDKDLARNVYGGIGEVRERGALIPLIRSAEKSDVVELAVMKWMNIAFNENQDAPIAIEKAKGLTKNFIQIKDWLMKRIDKSFTGAEEELLKDKSEFIKD
ncbi:MAG: hypothetical protein EU530_10980 [Promethearchaeota archaeon]|nr:MAG: hypothetical protein EU530_10980 [Candidatus Lokiarchaeota archaeon]